MNSIRATIAEYEAGCAAIQKRIDQLSLTILESRRANHSQAHKELLDRRYLLYTELWEMQAAIRGMREYTESGKEKTRRKTG